jgi:hypothetical protein
MDSRQASGIGIGASVGALLGGGVGSMWLDNMSLGLGFGAALGAFLGGIGAILGRENREDQRAQVGT